MTTPTFTLIVSIIVRLGEGGLTDVQPFTMLEACLQRQMSLDVRLKGKVAALDSRCEEVPPKPAFDPRSAVKPPPAIVEPVKPPPAIVKPVNGEAAKPHTAKRAAPSASSENCLHRKYRLVNGARRWYCKRWK
jgi:hypothetical protein